MILITNNMKKKPFIESNFSFQCIIWPNQRAEQKKKKNPIYYCLHNILTQADHKLI